VIIVAGDLNDNQSRRESSSPGRGLTEFLSNSDLVDTAALANMQHSATYFPIKAQKGDSARLDYVLLSPNLALRVELSGRYRVDMHMVDCRHHASQTLEDALTVDHAAFIVECAPWQLLLDEKYAQEQARAAWMARRAIPNWQVAAEEEKTAFREKTFQDYQDRGFDSVVQREDIEAVGGIFRKCIQEGATSLPRRVLGGPRSLRGTAKGIFDMLLDRINRWSLTALRQGVDPSVATFAEEHGFCREVTAKWQRQAQTDDE
jgi:hypothetical protein